INVSRSLDEVPLKSKNDMPPRDNSCLMSCEIILQVATWLNTFEEFTQGWVRLGCLDVDTQTTWMQRDYRETRAKSRNA
ncbi:hypothetical protein Tco_1511850, partial [Tanacetum coccineum]